MALLNDQRTHLVLTALAAALATYSILSISRTNRRVDLASGTTSSRVQSSPSCLLPQLPPAPEYTEQLVREQLARNYAFLGEEGVARVRRASVVVVGCGGVGSWVAVMLARSGVAQLRLIDFDYVTLSSLNRHATAALADVGTPKVQCVARALRAIAPFVQVDPRVELWRGGPEGADLLQGADWVIGAQ
jgi:tRNA threonylcarbamoyladenosine dehydratase